MRSVSGLVLWALCLAAPAEAQTGSVQAQPGTIAGVVIDDRTKQPIRGVAVYVESQANIVETDVNGRFSQSDSLRTEPDTVTRSVFAPAAFRQSEVCRFMVVSSKTCGAQFSMIHCVPDRWGEIYFVAGSSHAEGLPSLDELLTWLRHIRNECPECQGEAR